MASVAHSGLNSKCKCGFAVPIGMDPASLNVLFASCLPQLLRTATRMMKCKEDSEDALQNALLLGFRNIRQFRGNAKFSTWMHTILLNSVRSMQRRKVAQPFAYSLEGDFLDTGRVLIVNPQFSSLQTSEEICFNAERARMMVQFLKELPPTCREAFRLRHVEGFGIREIAQRLGIGIAATKARIHRARRVLERRVGKRKSSGSPDFAARPA